jgi:hypothetical protein
MTLFQIMIHHNQQSRFMPYEDGHHLETAVSHCLTFAPETTAEDIAVWAYEVFNVDLDRLEDHRTTEGGETTFLVASLYRLLGYRSLSVGDVVEVTAPGGTQWLACETFGWRNIARPTGLRGEPLNAEKVYARLAQLLRGSR